MADEQPTPEQQAAGYPNQATCNWNPAIVQLLMREIVEVYQLQQQTLKVCQSILDAVTPKPPQPPHSN